MSRARPFIAFSVLALAGAALVSTGCYERVVSAHGFGADGMTIERADSPDPVKTTKVRQSTTHKQLPPQRMRVHER